eukprot:gnl/TRDRNA2_/TRDRNA2_173434_c0_seq2.p1 gnl/TRDRNA2_/TRDRNA2_173434_c0~~gnl/TRDRNA2_/TRDRNA2_173434_c0_seq2.p1  ORF type:complete len:262 (-),score=34.62 gnl/TRDRNA2_/TRDRNA2_173434_c0_seq2:232-1017(-)
MLFQPIEWTAASYVVTFQAGLTVLVGLILLVPSALGKHDGFYKSYYQKYEKYEPLTDEGEDALRMADMKIGSENLYWGISSLGALIAGGGAQIMCILQLAPMLTVLYYFFKVNEKFCMIISCAFILAFCYLGFLSTPMLPTVVWQPAAVFLMMHSVLVLLAGTVFLTGKTASIYESQPHTKKFMNREREILMGTQLLGGALGGVGAVITNGPENYCLVLAPVFMVTGGVHWIGSGDKKNAINNWVVMLLFACFALIPQLLQ